MATMPPYDAKSAAKQAKAQARAQQFYQRNARRGYRPSMIGPLFLLLVGIVALLLEMGTLPSMPFWRWAAHWWPILFIAIGLLRLLEYFWDRKHPYAVTRGYGGAIVFVIILGLFSTAVAGEHNWCWTGFGLENCSNLWSTLGVHYDNQLQMTEPLHVKTGVTPVVNIQNPNGNVIVTASPDGKIYLKSHQMASTGSQSAANHLFAEGKPQITLTSTGANIVVPAFDGLSENLTIELPAPSSTVISAGHGDLTVEGMQASSQLDATHGDVKIEDMGAAVQVQMSNGDFSAHQIKGSLSLSGGGGDLAISDVTGATTIAGEYYGDIYVNQVHGPVQFRSSRTQIAIPHLLGSMTLDSGELGIDGASGPITITAHAKDMSLKNLSGDLRIEDNDGNINASLVQPLGRVHIVNHSGDVSLALPEEANFTFLGSTSDDEDLNSAFPFAHSQQNGRQILRGSNGSGGPLLEVSTTHGELSLQKVSSTRPKSNASTPHYKTKGEVKIQFE